MLLDITLATGCKVLEILHNPVADACAKLHCARPCRICHLGTPQTLAPRSWRAWQAMLRAFRCQPQRVCPQT